MGAAMPPLFMTVNNDAWRDVYRPTMVRELKDPGNHGTEVVMKDAGTEPDPEPIREPITVTMAAKWADLNDYKVGETVYADTAAFKGGLEETTTYRWRIQTRPAADGATTNGKWTNYTDHAEEIAIVLEEGGQIRFQCQARDTGVDPVEQVNSFASWEDVEEVPPPPPTTIGDVTCKVDNQDYDLSVAPMLTLLMDDPIAVALTISGDANPTYKWAARNDYPFTASEQAAETELTLHEEGIATITCDIADPTATDGTQTIIINFFVVDAKTWEELKGKPEEQ